MWQSREPHLQIFEHGAGINPFELLAKLVVEVKPVVALQGGFHCGNQHLLVVSRRYAALRANAQHVFGKLGNDLDHISFSYAFSTG